MKHNLPFPLGTSNVYTTYSVFCNPFPAYRWLKENEAFAKYNSFLDKRDELIRNDVHSGSYLHRREYLFHKGSRDLTMFEYSYPPITWLNGSRMQNGVTIKNFRFELENWIAGESKNKRLPDFEIFEVHGLFHEAKKGTQALKDILKTEEYQVFSERYVLPMEKYFFSCRYKGRNPTPRHRYNGNELMELAKKKVGYDVDRYSFQMKYDFHTSRVVDSLAD